MWFNKYTTWFMDSEHQLQYYLGELSQSMWSEQCMRMVKNQVLLMCVMSIERQTFVIALHYNMTIGRLDSLWRVCVVLNSNWFLYSVTRRSRNQNSRQFDSSSDNTKWRVFYPLVGTRRKRSGVRIRSQRWCPIWTTTTRMGRTMNRIVE